MAESGEEGKGEAKGGAGKGSGGGRGVEPKLLGGLRGALWRRGKRPTRSRRQQGRRLERGGCHGLRPLGGRGRGGGAQIRISPLKEETTPLYT
jgi:hypothetical protein